MGTRRKTACEAARHFSFSEPLGADVTSAAAIVAKPSGAVAADALVARCCSFLETSARIRALLDRWADLESEAFKVPGWFALSKEQQKMLPQSLEMAEIDKQLPGYFRQRETLLAKLPRASATNPTGIAAKVAVAAMAVDPEDNASVHFLLTRASQELTTMRCTNCNKQLVTRAWTEWASE